MPRDVDMGAAHGPLFPRKLPESKLGLRSGPVPYKNQASFALTQTPRCHMINARGLTPPRRTGCTGLPPPDIPVLGNHGPDSGV